MMLVIQKVGLYIEIFCMLFTCFIMFFLKGRPNIPYEHAVIYRNVLLHPPCSVIFCVFWDIEAIQLLSSSSLYFLCSLEALRVALDSANRLG